MNLNIYLEDDLAKELNEVSESTGNKRNSIIRNALRSYLDEIKRSSWSKEIMEFKGIGDFPRFESYRDELSESKRPDFLDK